MIVTLYNAFSKLSSYRYEYSKSKEILLQVNPHMDHYS